MDPVRSRWRGPPSREHRTRRGPRWRHRRRRRDRRCRDRTPSGARRTTAAAVTRRRARPPAPAARMPPGPTSRASLPRVGSVASSSAANGANSYAGAGRRRTPPLAWPAARSSVCQTGLSSGRTPAILPTWSRSWSPDSMTQPARTDVPPSRPTAPVDARRVVARLGIAAVPVRVPAGGPRGRVRGHVPRASDSTTPRSPAGWCSTPAPWPARTVSCARSRSDHSPSSASPSWPSRWPGALAPRVGAGAVIVGANVTTEVFKALAPPPDLVSNPLISFNTLPSGHSTVAASLRPRSVLVVPVRLRPARGDARRPLRRWDRGHDARRGLAPSERRGECLRRGGHVDVRRAARLARRPPGDRRARVPEGFPASWSAWCSFSVSCSG